MISQDKILKQEITDDLGIYKFTILKRIYSEAFKSRF